MSPFALSPSASSGEPGRRVRLKSTARYWFDKLTTNGLGPPYSEQLQGGVRHQAGAGGPASTAQRHGADRAARPPGRRRRRGARAGRTPAYPRGCGCGRSRRRGKNSTGTPALSKGAWSLLHSRSQRPVLFDVDAARPGYGERRLHQIRVAQDAGRAAASQRVEVEHRYDVVQIVLAQRPPRGTCCRTARSPPTRTRQTGAVKG